MMKNIFNRFVFLIAFCGLFVSCSNFSTSFYNEVDISKGKGKICISTDLQASRSVLPTAITDTTTGLKWELNGTKDGTQKQIQSWVDDTDGTTAYKKMVADTSIFVDVGEWKFTLTASTAGKNVLNATISATINAGENSLNFEMQEAIGENAATGSIEFTLNFPKEVVGNVVATLYEYDNNAAVDTNLQLSIDNSSSDDFDSVKYSYPSSTNSTTAELKSGYYILKIELQQSNGSTTAPTVEYKTINTYSCLVHVAPGLCSEGKAELDTLAPLYKVTFEGIEFEESIVPTSYNAYTTFALPTIKKEDGYEYEYQWYKKSSNSSSQESVDDPLNVSIKEDTTFGVKCYKIVAEDDIVRTAKGVSTGDSFSIGTAEGLAIFRDLVNGCDENLKMVDNSGESEDGYVYYDYSLVSQSQLNATLTSDIDLTHDADGNELSWVPINGYSGTFDGGGHTITVNNTYYSNEGVYYQGFFDMLDGATIKNLVVAGEETISESGLPYCGGIVSQIENARGVNTTFENCVNKRNITVSADVEKLGGFAGYTYSKNSETTNFVNCINLGTIENNYNASEDYDPYVAGFTTGATSYKMCINAGNVTGATYLDNSDGAASGTVAGFDASVSAKFENCINLGDISANSYTSDGKSCSTEKVYGFSSIDQYNFPTFTKCIDAGSAKCPFTGVVDNTTGKYDNSYYNSDSYSSGYNIDYAKTSDDLCIKEKTNFSNWSYDSSRYPLPNITEGVSSEIWQEVEAKATLPKGTRGNPFVTWKELADYVSTSSDSEATVYIAGTLEATSMTYVYRPVTIMATGNATIKRVGNCTNFFQVPSNKSLKITGTAENNIILDGGNTSTIPLVVEFPLIQVSQTGGSVTLEYCTIQNANCGTDPYGAGLYATSNTSVTIKNCTFRNNTGYDISIQKCNNLTLSGNVEIPKLYFKNEYTNSELTIKVGEDLAGSVNIVLDIYEDEKDLYDLELFNLVDGTSLPEGVLGVFTLDNPCYAIDSSGKIVGITTYSDWTTLVSAITNASNTTSEFVLSGNLTATSTITVSGEITLKAPAGTTITRGADDSGKVFTGAFFDNQSTLTLEGITLDGGNANETSIEAEAPLITSSGSLTLNNCTLQNNNNSNATETGTGIFLQINDTSSLCSFNDVSFGENSSNKIPHIKIKNNTGEKFTFNLGGSLAGGVPSIDMPSTTCINITESLTIPDGESIKITLDEYTIGNRIISANEGINVVRENFSLTTTEESWFIDSTGYLAKGELGEEPSKSETGEYVVSSLDNLLWIARELKTGSITSFNMKLTEDIVIESGKWQFYQLNVSNSSTIDGQGHSITIDEDVSNFGNDAGGLFYKFNNSTVKNLVLKGSITANTSAGGYIGALCRSAYGSIFENVMSEVTITDNGSGFAGGLIGRLGTSVMYDPTKAMVKNCAVYADVSSTNGIAGGILGAIWENTRCCTIQNSIYMGKIKGTTVGAIVGKNENNDVAESVLNNIWYCVTNNSSIPLIGTKADTTVEEITAVESKSAEEIATPDAAKLLNTNSDGTSNDAWKYVEGAYPTLKSVN